jgi:carboxyl-terminal processing protease
MPGPDNSNASSNQPHQPQRKQGKILSKLGIFFLSVALVLLVFAAGNLASHTGLLDLGQLLRLNTPLTQSAATPTDEVTAEQLAARLDEVANLINHDSLYRYTQEDLDTATTESINALLALSGDRYARYMPPDEYEAYLKSTEGEYAGIGISLSSLNGEISVIDVYEDSPASEAGIQPGDVLLAIDGDRHAWEIQEAIDTIRRPAGEEVTLIWRRGTQERETTSVVRPVTIPTVVTHLIEKDGHSVGYLSLRGFNMQSAADIRASLDSLEAAGVEGFILDLRNNPGGYLEQAIDIASLFVPQGAVVQVESREGIRTRSVTGKLATDKALVVLVNGDSASASELLAAALQDHERAIIVGQQTYGKGTMQSIYTLSWGGALRYTVAHYMSPFGNTVDGVGVTPDIEVAQSTTPVELSATDHIGASSYRYSEGIDLQLDAALEALLNPPAGR